jgi:hypothetical protein
MMAHMEMTLTSSKNCERFVDTGENSLLGNVVLGSAPHGTRAVLAAEGIERVVVLAADASLRS